MGPMERMLARKPLHPAERNEPPCTVCVTGGGGYIASSIVCRLLAMGHTIHATWRPEDDSGTIAAVKALPGAEERVKWFEADLMRPGSYDEAVRGCKYVIHTATPVIEDCHPEDGCARVINPALKGVENVFGAVNKSNTVERVIMTSSIWAAIGKYNERGQGYVYNEEDWSLNFDARFPYATAKTYSDWQAFALCAQQQRWSLATIQAAITLGPPVAACPQLFGEVRRLLTSPFTMPTGYPTVDLHDVAAAHTLAMVDKHAHGRYLLCQGFETEETLVNWLRQRFPEHRSEVKLLPFWACLALSLLPGFHVLKHSMDYWYGKQAAVSTARVSNLGLALIPFQQSLTDMIKSLEDLAVLPSAA